MANLETAIEIALKAHRGQVDKAQAPYVLHPLRLMLEMSTEEDMMVAVLHDVVEDSDVSATRLREEGFSPDVISAVLALTRGSDESYEAFIQRLKTNPIARRVKLADLEDNMNTLRLRRITDRDLERLRRYHTARLSLLDETPDKPGQC